MNYKSKFRASTGINISTISCTCELRSNKLAFDQINQHPSYNCCISRVSRKFQPHFNTIFPSFFVDYIWTIISRDQAHYSLISPQSQCQELPFQKAQSDFFILHNAFDRRKVFSILSYSTWANWYQIHKILLITKLKYNSIHVNMKSLKF